MKKLLFVLTLFCGAEHASAQMPATRLDSLLNFYHNEYAFNGVAFIASKGTIIMSKGYGYRDRKNGILNDENSIFQMGSNTKQFTSEVILQLVREGKMDVQDKLTKYFPDYPGGEKISIENLLTHTSGIYNYTDNSFLEEHAVDHKTEAEVLALFKDKPSEFEPGAKFQYSNSNYILLGMIIEQLTGQPYEQVVRSRILTPLHMDHSGFDFTHLADKNKAVGYYSLQGDLYNEAPITDSSLSFAAGALYSTVADMYKWHQALENYTLLPKEWQEKAFTPFKDRYAYGWIIDTMPKVGKRLVGHSGGIPGFGTYEMRVTEDDLCILLLQNCMQQQMSNNSICINILKCIYDPTYTLPAKRVAVNVAKEVLKRYAGEYAITPDFSITIKAKDDQLYAQGTGQDEFPMSAASETKFFSKEVGAEITFEKDGDGKFSRLILNQGGSKIPAIRKAE